MDPNKKNKTFMATTIGSSDSDGILTPVGPKTDHAADARQARETQILRINVLPAPNTVDDSHNKIESESEEDIKETEVLEETSQETTEDELEENNDTENVGYTQDRTNDFAEDESDRSSEISNSQEGKLSDRSESDSEQVKQRKEIGDEYSTYISESDSEEIQKGTEIGENVSSQRDASDSEEVVNGTEIGENVSSQSDVSDSEEVINGIEIRVILRPLLREAHNANEINTDLAMVVVDKKPNNIIWLIGSHENKTFNSPYGRCLIEKIFEIVIDSDSLLMVHGTDKFCDDVKDLYNHSKLMSEAQHLLAYISEDLFIKTEFPSIDQNEKPIFQCAFVFEIHDHQYTKSVEQCVNAIPVIMIQDISEEENNGADSNGSSILMANPIENNQPSILRDPITHTRIYWDFQQSIETENIDHSGVVGKIITAFKTHYMPTEPITEKIRSQWILLCISLNYNDTEFEQHIKDLNKNLKREAMLAISLHRQQFLTLLCKNGFDRGKSLDDEFMLKLYTKEKWKKYAVAEEEEEDDQMQRIKANLKSRLKQRIGSILFGKDIKDELENSELLFITSVLESKLELSLVFWTYVRHPIAAALIAYGIFKSMKTSGHKYENILEENMITYRKLSIEATFKGFFRDKMKIFELLTQEIPEWGNLSCIDIALDTRNEKFLSKTPTILLRSHIWSGEPKKNSTSDAESASKKACHCCHITPLSIWILSLISNIILFVLYSFLLVTTLEASSFHWLEGIVLLRVVMFPIMIILSWRRFVRRIDNIFNVLKIISLVLFVMAWIFRIAAYFKMDTPELMQVARVLYSATLMIWAFDFLKYFYNSETFGPIVEMIFQMMSTLCTFIILILVFIVGYSVASESVLYPNAAINIKLPFYLFRKSFWSIFGQLFLEELETTDGSCTNDPALYNDYSTTRCPSEEGRYWVPMILGAYVVVVNILLINLLIAKFNSIITYIEIKAQQIWHYQNFQIAMEYREIYRRITCNRRALQSKTSEVTFEKKVVEYLKQQIDDGRFFKRLEAYKKTKAKSLHGVFSSLKDITESLSKHGQLLEFQTDVIKSLKESHVVFDDLQKLFDDKTVGVIDGVKSNNSEAASSLNVSSPVNIITDKLQKDHEQTAEEINKGYKKMLQHENLENFNGTALNLKGFFEEKLHDIEIKTTDINAAIAKIQETVESSTQKAKSSDATISKLEEEFASSQTTLKEINETTRKLKATYPKFTGKQKDT